VLVFLCRGPAAVAVLFVLVFLAAAYQLLDEMLRRETGEVTSPYAWSEMILSIHTSYQISTGFGPFGT
jgi:hypothetical protein